jgi:hypothetical protein
MAIRESIVFEVDATQAAQGFASMEKGADAMATSVARADDALTAVQKEAAALGTATAAAGKASVDLTGAVATQANATAQAATQTGNLTKALTAEASAAQSANVALESTARTVATTARSAESASRNIGQVARASGEPIARLAGILGGQELGSGIARMFQLERGLYSVGQVGAAAGVGLSRLLAPLALITVAVEGVSLALGYFTDDTKKATAEAEKFETAAQKIASGAQAIDDRLNSLSGEDRLAALSTAISSVRSEIGKLGEAGKGDDFASLGDARDKLAAINAQLERTKQTFGRKSELEGILGGNFGAADAFKDFDKAIGSLESFEATAKRIGGIEFVPTAGIKAAIRDFPELTKAIAEAEQRGVAGLVDIATAFDTLRKAEELAARSSKTATDAFAESRDTLRAEADAIIERRLAVEELVASGVGLEAALRQVSNAQDAQIRAEREAAEITKRGGEINDEKRAALLRSAEAAVAARVAFEDFVSAQKAANETAKELGQTLSGAVAGAFDKLKSVGGSVVGAVGSVAGSIAGGFGSSGDNRAAEAAQTIESGLRLEALAYSRTRNEVEKLMLEEDIRANNISKSSGERLRQLQAEAQAMRKIRETGDALGGGAGDTLRALRDGESGGDALRAGLQGAGDRIFDTAVRNIEESIGAGFASIFGGAAPGITPGESAIVQAVNQTTAAVNAAGVGGEGGAGVGAGAAAAASSGFNFGQFGTSLAIGGLGILASRIGRGGRRGGNDDTFDVAPFERGGRGSGVTYNQNRVTVNNFGSSARAPTTSRQDRKDPGRLWR